MPPDCANIQPSISELGCYADNVSGERKRSEDRFPIAQMLLCKKSCYTAREINREGKEHAGELLPRSHQDAERHPSAGGDLDAGFNYLHPFACWQPRSSLNQTGSENEGGREDSAS